MLNKQSGLRNIDSFHDLDGKHVGMCLLLISIVS